MIRNLVGQVAEAELIDSLTGAGFVGSVVVYVTIDIGAQALGTVAAGVATARGFGVYQYFPSAAETNGVVCAFTFVASGAVPVTVQYRTLAMTRNQAGQTTFAQLITATTGAAFAGAVTVYPQVDGAVQGVGAAATLVGNGLYRYLPAQAETNGTLCVFTFAGTGSIPVSVQYPTLTAAEQVALSSAAVGTTISSSVSPIVTFNKDALATLDFTIDWRKWLGNDTIAASSWAVSSGIANVGSMYSGTTATIWLGGGVAGVAYYAYSLISTVAGRTDKRTIKINVVNR